MTREEVSRVFSYDSDFDRQRQRERTAQIRAEYRRCQAYRPSPTATRARRYARSAWSHVRWAIPRRAPVFRA